jgi:transposase
MNRRKFTAEYKQEAVRLVLEQGLSVAQAALDLGIGKSTLENWVRKQQQNQPGEPITESEKDELKRLRKEVHTLRMERDILKKATAYFAKNTP